MSINSEVTPFHTGLPEGASSGNLEKARTDLTNAGFTVTGDTKTWINSHWSDSVYQVIKTIFWPNDPAGTHGIFSYSNMGVDDDLMADLKKLDNVLAGIGTAPAAASPAQAAGAQQVIPAGAGATIVINIYPGAAAPVQVAAPAAHSPGQDQPATSGLTQTIDAPASKLTNDIQWLKALKEKVAAKLQELENLQNELQLQAKQEKEAMKKELEKNKDEG